MILYQVGMIERRENLCETCAHVKRYGNDRGSVFLQCGRAKDDARFAKYPRLPVLRCEGWEPVVRSIDPPR
jgi:hypothetical protein